MTATELPRPARYTPWVGGVYEVAPSLRPLGTDFGNGDADRRVFQLDSEIEKYRKSKSEALAENPAKYLGRSSLEPSVEAAARELIWETLKRDYPERFGEVEEPSSLDELALEIQEDFVIVSTRGGKDWVSYINVCSPSHWTPTEKLGGSFFDVHQPVPGFDRINAVAPALVDAMVKKGPFVRFVWGVESDAYLNHHPEAAPGHDPELWWGRDFRKGKFWARVERQVIVGLPAVGAAIFSIRVSLIPGSDVMADERLRASLVSALLSMSPAARTYKGLDRHWDALTASLGG